MIASSQIQQQDLNQPAQDRFLGMLPRIRQQAGLAFRGIPAEQKDELVQEVIAHAYVAYRRLIDQGKAGVAYATPLASYAIRRVRAGRKAAGKSHLRDALSPRARTTSGLVVERLDRFDRRAGQWREALVEDRRATPADIAAARIDVATWFGSLSRRNRQIAQALAAGETASDTAQRFQLSQARISQLRRELKASWERFQGEAAQLKPSSQRLQRGRVALFT